MHRVSACITAVPVPEKNAIQTTAFDRITYHTRAKCPWPATPALDRCLHLRPAYLRAVANDGGKGSGYRENVARHRSILLRLQGGHAGRVSAIPRSRVRGTIIGARDASQIQTRCRVGVDG